MSTKQETPVAQGILKMKTQPLTSATKHPAHVSELNQVTTQPNLMQLEDTLTRLRTLP